MSKSNSEHHARLNRRQALLLPAAGIAAGTAVPARAADSVKTAAHQAPGGGATPRSAVATSDATRCQTMVFDNHCRMVDDPEGEVRRILLS